MARAAPARRAETRAEIEQQTDAIVAEVAAEGGGFAEALGKLTERHRAEQQQDPAGTPESTGEEPGTADTTATPPNNGVAAADGSAEQAKDRQVATARRDTAERMPRLLHLSKLRLAPGNVRRGGRVDLDQLAADILAHGLLQNLGVVAAADGLFDVHVGGRRLRAMQLLAKRGDWDKDAMVAAIILTDAEAGEAGLAENFQQLPMNPADAALAFAEAVRAGRDEAEIAARFGVKERFVRQRLRLAGLHESVLAALKAGKISLDVAEAYASVPDPARQAAVMKTVANSSYERDNPDSIRRRMKEGGVRPTAAEALFVGRAAYLAAGGTFEADLFAAEDDELWTDEPLLQQLAGAKLAGEADALRAKFGFARVLPWIDWHDEDAATAELSTFDKRWTDFTQLPEGVRSQLVVLAIIGQGGAAVIDHDQAWIEAGSRIGLPPEPAASPVKPRETGEADDGELKPPPVEAEPEAKGISQALKDALAMRRRDTLALAMLAKPEGSDGESPGDDAQRLAFAAMVFMLAENSKRFANDKLGTAMRATTQDLNEPLTVTPLPWDGDPLSAAIAAAMDDLDDGWRRFATETERWHAFCQLAPGQHERWMQAVVALTLRATPAGVLPFHFALAKGLADAGALVPLPVWRPTAANYFDKANQATRVAMLEECLGPGQSGAAWAKMKRGDLSPALEALARGDAEKLGGLGGVPRADVEARGRAWLPKEMLFEGGK